MSALSFDPLILGVFIGIIDDPDNQGTRIPVIFGVHAQLQQGVSAAYITPDRCRKQLSNQKFLLWRLFWFDGLLDIQFLQREHCK